MKNLIPIFLFLLFTCCSSKPKEETSTNNDTSTTKSLPILNLAEVIDKQVPDTFTWNSLAQKTTLIPLETTGRHSLLGSSPHVQFIGNDLLVVAEFQTNTLYLYDGKGKLKHSFRHVGMVRENTHTSPLSSLYPKTLPSRSSIMGIKNVSFIIGKAN